MGVEDINLIDVFVKSIDQETPLVKRFKLEKVDAGNLPAFSAGSHVATYINGFERNYSLTGQSEVRDYYEIAIRLSNESSGGSKYWHQQVKVGDLLQISYPKNHFPLSFRAKHHVFYAAGIGITPFLSMMAEVKENGGTFELHYTSKSEEQCAFYGFLKKDYPNESHFYFTQGKELGRISTASLLEHRIGTHVYFCGPERFNSEFSTAAYAFGYPESSVHVERFTPPRPKSLRPFTAQFVNGAAIHVHNESTLLEELLQAGVKAPYSCRVGRCGTCELKVLEGSVDHYDSFLSEEQKKAQNVILPCVSRGKSEKIIIDFK